MISEDQKQAAETQILEEKIPVDYDTREFTVEHIIDMYLKGEYKIPLYQRKFIWSQEKQSRFIESILLDLPIQYLFFADDKSDGKLEIVDGSQRIRTLVAFKDNDLELKGLNVLFSLNGYRFEDLLESRQRRFSRKTLRSIELTEKATFESKKDIFQRINTDPYDLTDMEIRKGMYQEGAFYGLIDHCSNKSLFAKLCPTGGVKTLRGEKEELVLRFFAYRENYQNFNHRVDVFLDSYMKEMDSKQVDLAKFELDFDDMLAFVSHNFPAGFKKSIKDRTTPRVRFEAISVGVGLALSQNPNLKGKSIDISWIKGSEFKEKTTSDGANSKKKVVERIDFVKNKILRGA